MAGLGEKDVGESKVRVSTRAKEVILKRLNLLKMSGEITQEEIDKIMSDVWKFYGGTQRD